MTPFAQFIVWVAGIAGASTVGIVWAWAWSQRGSRKDDDE